MKYINYIAFVSIFTFLTGSSSNAAPKGNANRTVFDINEDVSAEFTDLCGVPLTATITGWISVRTFKDQQGAVQNVELDNVHVEFLISNSDGESVRLLDIGPNRFFNENGILLIQLSGRFVDFVGTLTFNVETNDLEFSAGRGVDLAVAACGPLI